MTALDDMIARLESLPKALEQVAPKVAEAVAQAARAELAAGRGIDGTAWSNTKAGKRALAGAADAIQVRAVGSVILISIDGAKYWYRAHNIGTAKVPQRRLLPSGGIPPAIEKAIRSTVEAEIGKLLRA